MKIKIAYLYYDLLNLYGESGNIKALKHALKISNTNIDYLTINDKIDFKKYDMIYIGMGTEDNLHIALNDIMKYRDDLKNYIEDNKIILATGNSFEMFGKNITHNNFTYEALNIFDYETEDTDKRIVGNIKEYSSIINKDIIGFVNRGSIINKSNFIGNGFFYKNFFGTYMIGPILVRNPSLLLFFINKLTNKNIKPNLYFEKKAYKKDSI